MMSTRTTVSPWLTATLLILLAILLPLQAAMAAVFTGRVVDDSSEEPLSGATVRLLGSNAFAVTDEHGLFTFNPVPPGVLGIAVRHVGYQEYQRALPELTADIRVRIRLEPISHKLDAVILEEALREGDATFTRDPAVAMGGTRLQQELGGTLAETLAEEPGISQRTLGPGPARPVLRGMGGERLRILENGRATGDLSAGSSDHAVAIDPASAHDITVFRGPETVLYGPATPGGVVDVERSAPLDRLDHNDGHVRLTAQGESVNQARVIGGDVTQPLGEIVLHADATLRRADDLRTPDGDLENTGLSSTTVTGSAAWVPGYGDVGLGGVSVGGLGAAVTLFQSDYGIPGGFIGGHPGGVDIELERMRYDTRLRVDLAAGVVEQLEFDLSVADYTHSEVEASGRVGMRFDVASSSLRTLARLEPVLGAESAALGLELSDRGLSTGGLTFTPNTSQRALGGFAYARWRWDRWAMRAGLRVDGQEVVPDRERDSVVIGRIAARSFSGFSGSLAVSRVLAPEVAAHATVTRSYRAPGIEELFSEGPHLAAYSYEVGNPILGPETAWTGELGITHVRPRFHQRFTVFTTAFDSYLYARNTGHPSARRNDLIEYRHDAADALFSGAETTFDIDLPGAWSLDGSGSFVWAQNRDEDRPIERIPPLTGRVGLTWAPDPWAVTLRAVGAARQDRTGEFETPSAAWARLDLLAKVEQPWGGGLHVLSLAVTNLTDTAYRNHLSRIKTVLPEPGRNISLVWRVYL